jgi:polyisoprenoid-binding protein YceI
MRVSRTSFAIAPLAMLGFVFFASGCANPADDKPAAVVAEARTEAAPKAAPSESQIFEMVPPSSISFVGSKVTGKHDGGFNSFHGEIQVVGGDPTQSSIRLVIDTNSLWSDNERLTGHLKSPDFFEVETYPTATFESTSIVAQEGGHLVTGNLDLHGVTKSVSFPAQVAVSPDRITAQAEFSIKRFDWGIVYPGMTDDLIRDDVVVKFDLVATPKSSATAAVE